MVKALIIRYKNMNKQLKVVFWFTAVGFLQKGISMITTPIFTRVLSTDDYGMFSVFSSYYSVLVIIATLYLHQGVINNAFVKTKNSNEKVVSAFQSLSLVISSSFFILALIFREELGKLMGIPSIVVVFIFLGYMFLEPYHLWVIYKRYQFDYVKPVIVTVIVSIMTPLVSVIAILLAKENQGIVRVMSYVIVNSMLPGLFFYLVNYNKDKTFYDKKLWKYAITFNVPLLVHYFSETLLNQTDRIMINKILGPTDAGIYSVAFAAAAIFTIFSSALNTAFIPWTYQKIKAKDYKQLAKISYLVLIGLAVILSVMIMFAPEVVMILAGNKYTGAVYLIPTLSASVFFGYMYQIFSRIELYYEKKSYTVISTIVATVLNIILNAWWIPIWGYTAAGYSTLVSHIVFCLMHYIFYKKVNRESMDSVKVFDGKILLGISVLILLLSFVMTLLYNFFILRIIIIGVLIIIAILLRKKIKEVYVILRAKK